MCVDGIVSFGRAIGIFEVGVYVDGLRFGWRWRW